MNVKGLGKNIKQDYLIWGFALSILLTLLGTGCDGYAQAVLVVIFVAISGLISNAIVFMQFVRRYYAFIILMVAWIIWFCAKGDGAASIGLPLTAFCIIFASYIMTMEGKHSLRTSVGKLCVVICIFIIVAVIWKLSGQNAVINYFPRGAEAFSYYQAKLIGVYLHPVAAACVYLCFTLLCFLFIDNVVIRFVSSALGLAVIWISASRAGILVLAISLSFFFVVRLLRHESSNDLSPKTSRGDKVIAVSVLLLMAVVVFVGRDTIFFLIKRVFTAFTGSGDADASNTFRLDAWKHVLSEYGHGSFLEIVFGRGYDQAAASIMQVPELAAMDMVKPFGVKNIFISLLFDYGLAGLSLMVFIVVNSLIYFIKGKERMQRRIGLIVLSMLAVGFIFDLQYWECTMYILFAFIGAYLGLRDLNYLEKKADELGSKKPLRIAMFGQKNVLTNEGGVEVVSRELASIMTERGNEVTCYNRSGHHVSGTDYDVDKRSEWNGIKLKYVPTIEKKGFAALPSAFFAAVYCMFGKFDVVHIHAEGPSVFCWMPKLMGKRVICHIHGLDHQRVKWGKAAKQMILWGERSAVNYADEMIVLSRGTQKYFVEKYGRSTVFIPNAVDEFEKHIPELIAEKWGLKEESYILFLGRMVPEKGIEYLIRAYKEICKVWDGAKPGKGTGKTELCGADENTVKKLVIAGGSSDTDAFVAAMKELAGDDDRIIFTGFVDGQLKQELYSNAYVYVLPSDVEGMPLSLLEALSYGNCCLVSDIDECAEVVEDHGVTFRHSNVESLKKRLSDLMSTPEKVAEFKAGAAEFVHEKYKWSECADMVEHLYRALPIK